MDIKGPKNPKPKKVTISVTLEPGTEEFRAYNRIKKKYLTEMAERQKGVSDDTPCKSTLNNRELVRGSLFALDEVPKEELPNYIDAAWKPKGRPVLNAGTEDGDETDSDANLDGRDTLLH